MSYDIIFSWQFARFEFAKGLPSSDQELEAFTEDVFNAVVEKSSSFYLGSTSITLANLPEAVVAQARNANNPYQALRCLQQLEGGLAFVDTSSKPWKFVSLRSKVRTVQLKTFHESLKKAATQLKGEKPGMIWAQFRALLV